MCSYCLLCSCPGNDLVVSHGVFIRHSNCGVFCRSTKNPLPKRNFRILQHTVLIKQRCHSQNDSITHCLTLLKRQEQKNLSINQSLLPMVHSPSYVLHTRTSISTIRNSIGIHEITERDYILHNIMNDDIFLPFYV